MVSVVSALAGLTSTATRRVAPRYERTQEFQALSTERISSPRLLHCGVSIRLMSQMGQNPTATRIPLRLLPPATDMPSFATEFSGACPSALLISPQKRTFHQRDASGPQFELEGALEVLFEETAADDN
jgi:hypothetical protein